MQLIYFLGIAASLRIATCLRCYSCTNLESSSSLYSGKSNPRCGRSGFSASGMTVTTCSAGESCVFVTGTMTSSIPFAGNVKIKVDDRACTPRVGSGAGCVSDSSQFKNILSTANILASLTNFQVSDVDVCYCNTDLCNGGCPKLQVQIGGRCLSIFIFIGVGCGVLIILICCCCCCCCCSCCKSKPKPATNTVVVQPCAVVGQVNPAPPQVFLMQGVAGHTATINGQPARVTYIPHGNQQAYQSAAVGMNQQPQLGQSQAYQPPSLAAADGMNYQPQPGQPPAYRPPTAAAAATDMNYQPQSGQKY